MQRSWGSPRSLQEGMLTLKVSVKITHIHVVSVGSLPSRRCAREAGDRVFSCVGWGSRPRAVSELIYPHVATLLSIGRGHLKFRGAHGISLQSCRGSLLLLFTSFPSLSLFPLFLCSSTHHPCPQSPPNWGGCCADPLQIQPFISKAFFAQIEFSTG